MEIQKVVMFNGEKYILLGKKRKYYLSWATTRKEKKRAKGLHVAIWEFYNKKEVPKGWVVHHKDGNTLNNDISNLECLPACEHYKIPKRINELSVREHLAKIRPLATLWHKSEEGKIWHKKHALEIARNLKYKTLKCIVCGKEFQSKYSNAKFCSGACGQKQGRQSGRWNEERKCIICGKSFITNKYQKVKTCSKSCRYKYIWQIRAHR